MHARNPKLLLLAGALLVAASPPARAEGPRLGDAVSPVSQELAFTLDPAREEYDGLTRVALRVRRPVTSFRFHAEGLEVLELGLSPAGGGPVAVRHQPVHGDQHQVTASEPLAAGDYTLEVAFRQRFNTQAVSLYRVEHEGRAYVFSQMEVAYARQAFPCWDEPQHKIPFAMEVRVPAGQTAVTNAPLRSEREAGGWRTITFAPTPPLPTYLVALAAGPFERVPVPGMAVPTHVVTVAGEGGLAGLAAEMTPPILAVLEEWFASPYPFAKLDLIAVPDFWWGGMENPGAITFPDWLLLVEPGGASAAHRRDLALTLAHELAHMWFGDLVTPRWWDDLWLTEAFASWMEVRATAQAYPQLEAELYALRDRQWTMAEDARPSVPAVRRQMETAVEVLDGLDLAYAKGRAVLGTIERWLGPEVFRRGVLAYLEEHAWGSASGEDFWRALSRVAGREVAPVAASLLDQPGVPLLHFALAEDGVVTVTQRRLASLGAPTPVPEPSWWLPVHLRWGTRDGRQGETAMLLTAPRQQVPLGEGVEWVVPDAGATGYYRWTLAGRGLATLAARAGERLEVGERIALVGNATALLRAGTLSGGELLALLEVFGDDPEPAVVAATLDALGTVRRLLIADASAGDLAPWLRRVLAPALQRVGASPRPGEADGVAVLRPQLLRWLGDAGADPDVRRQARRLAEEYLGSPAAIDASLAAVALDLAALDGDERLFRRYLRAFESAGSPAERSRLLSALGCFQRPELRESALRFALSPRVQASETFDVISCLYRTEAGAREGFSWIAGNYEALAGRLPGEVLALLPEWAPVCSPEDLEAAQGFFAGPAGGQGELADPVARLGERGAECMALRRQEGENVAAYLRRHSGPEASPAAAPPD
ncbi:MAG TPA: M1 family metallopeptidase [Thermoanaerobaculia bacterium]|nr:M1 family metallopeptidase [Thermoanaerobaculia bacterium]